MLVLCCCTRLQPNLPLDTLSSYALQGHFHQTELAYLLMPWSTRHSQHQTGVLIELSQRLLDLDLCWSAVDGLFHKIVIPDAQSINVLFDVSYLPATWDARRTSECRAARRSGEPEKVSMAQWSMRRHHTNFADRAAACID